MHTSNINDTKVKLSELDSQIEKFKDLLAEQFKAELKQLFVDNPKLEQISMYLNNHEFNDGDATSFYLDYESMTITVDGQEYKREYNYNKNEYVSNPLLTALITLFESCQNIHEKLYGDEYENLTINREDILKN